MTDQNSFSVRLTYIISATNEFRSIIMPKIDQDIRPIIFMVWNTRMNVTDSAGDIEKVNMDQKSN